jgi:hypothetical protein
MKILDYWITSYKITPPIGNVFSWGAKATVITEDKKQVQLGERWGRDKKEAEEKARKSINSNDEENTIS